MASLAFQCSSVETNAPSPAPGPTSVSGGITTDTTWDLTSSPYVLSGTVTVAAGVTLTIEPGVVVKGLSQGSWLRVQGTLVADGTEAAPIVFTSYRDDTVGGDTNEDGDISAPAAGEWIGIGFDTTSTASVLDHVEVRYAGWAGCCNSNLGTSSASIATFSSGLAISASRVVDGWGSGIRVVEASPTITGNEVARHGTGIEILQSAAQITGNSIQGNASVGLHVSLSPGLSITGNTITGNGGGGLTVQADSTGAQIASNLITGNLGGNGIHIHQAAVLQATTTWASDTPYVLSSMVTVAAGVTLTIEPGVVVKGGLWQGDRLHVQGTLVAGGTEAEPIVFTSYRDDTVGGDTNGDGADTVPAAGDWVGIGFDTSSTASVLDHVEVRYAGWADLYNGNLVVGRSASIATFSSGLTITASRLVDGPVSGIWAANASPTITGNEITRHGIGIELQNSAAEITGNTIRGNYYGAINGTALAVVAQGNYWGDPSGPHDPSDDSATGGLYNPSGLGDRVSDYVDYGSWLASDPNAQNSYGLSGSVFDAATYAAVPGATVYLGPYSAISNSGGSYSFSGLPASMFQLGVARAGYLSHSSAIDLVATASRSIYLVPTTAGTCGPGTLSGSVRDATTGAAKQGVEVRLGTGATATTNGSGAYSFPSLAAGTYGLGVTLASYAPFNGSVGICGNRVRDISLTKPQAANGLRGSSPISGDPVNTATGNYIFQRRDLDVPAPGIPFVFERTYNSLDPAAGPLGWGWTHNWEAMLSEDAEGNVTIRWGDGRTETWAPDGGGGFTPQYGVFDTLVGDGDGSFSLRRRDLVIFDFDAAGKLASLADRNGNTVTLSYSGGALSQITDPGGREYAFMTVPGGRITQITDPIGRTIVFAYDGAGDLVSSTDPKGNATLFTYDGDHQLLTVVDPRGHTVVENTYDASDRVVTVQRDALAARTTYDYDELNRRTTVIQDADGIAARTVYFHDELLRLVREEDHFGHAMSYEYDERGNRTRVVDRKGNETEYAYDAAGNVVSKTDALGNPTIITYDPSNNPLSRTDALGHTTLFEYDPAGNLIRTSDALVGITEVDYDARGLPTAVRDPNGNESTHEYDGEGNRIRTVDAIGHETLFEYDGVGRREKRTDALGHATQWIYDPNDNLAQILDALLQSTSYAYDENDNRISTTDALARTTSFVYDEKDRLIQSIDPAGSSTLYAYDTLDRRTGVTDRRGNPTSFVYDQVGNLLERIDTLGRSTSYGYDANRSRVSETDPLGHTALFTYDALDRLVTVTDPLLHTASTGYDEIGRVVSRTDAKGRTTQLDYDALGRLVEVTDPKGGKVFQTFDPNGNRLSQTDPNGNVTLYAYDALDRRIRMTEALGGVTTYVFDEVGNRISMTDPNGATTGYGYDELDRLTSAVYPGGPTVTYSYDAVGKRLTMQDGLGNTTYAYDPLRDWVTEVTDSFGKSVGYGYDAEGNRTSLIYPDGEVVAYGYDALNRMQTVTDWLGGVTTYHYDPAGRLFETELPNGTRALAGYDDADRLVSLQNLAPDDSVITSHAFVLDAVGNPTSETRSVPLEASPPGVGETYTYEPENRLQSLDRALSGLTTYAHDANGNRIQDGEAAGGVAHVFDARNLLATRASPGAIVEHVYDGDGRRMHRTESGFETRYVLDTALPLFSVIQETGEAGSEIASYVYGLGLVQRIDPTGSRGVYHYDRGGNTLALTDAVGVVTNAYSYSPFGEVLGRSGSAPNVHSFVGAQGLAEEADGLFWARARYYAGGTARFIGKDVLYGDPVRSQTLNRYSYGLASPLSYVDPSGLFSLPTLATGLAQTATGYGRLGFGLGTAYLHIASSTLGGDALGVAGAGASLFRDTNEASKDVAAGFANVFGSFLDRGAINRDEVRGALDSVYELPFVSETSDVVEALAVISGLGRLVSGETATVLREQLYYGDLPFISAPGVSRLISASEFVSNLDPRRFQPIEDLLKRVLEQAAVRGEATGRRLVPEIAESDPKLLQVPKK